MRCTSLLQLHFIELRLEEPHGILAVPHLGATLGILYHDLLLFTGVRILVKVVEAYAGLHLVHILATRTGGTESIPTQVGRIDLNFDGVIYQGYHEDRSKGGHSFALCIVWGDTHQAMYPVLAFQKTVCQLSLHLKGGGFDAGVVAILPVGDSGPVVLVLTPALIHPEEH